MQSKRIMYTNETDKNANMKERGKLLIVLIRLSIDNLRNLDVKTVVVAPVVV